MKIGIIGGGISGLAAAVQLVEAGQAEGRPVAITILESRSVPGGLLRTLRQGDSLIENSADMFTTKLPFGLHLCEKIGYLDQLIPTEKKNRGARLVTERGIEAIPEGFSLMVPKRLSSLMRSRILSPSGKLRVLLEPVFALARRHYRTGKEEDQSLQDFAIRHWGKELFEKLIQPLVAGIYTADPAKLSMKAALPEFVEWERQCGRLLWSQQTQATNEADGDFQDSLSAGGGLRGPATRDEVATGARYGLFVAPRLGMQHWVQAIMDWLQSHDVQFQFDCHVTGLQKHLPSETHSGWQVECLQGDSPCTLDFDGIVLATPVQKSAILARSVEPSLSESLGQLTSASAAIVVGLVPREALPQQGQGLGFGLVIPEYLKRPMIAASFGSNKFPGRCPNDQILVRCFFGGALHPEFMSESDDSLIELAQSELRSLLQAPQLILNDSRVVRWEQAMPQYHVGHVERVTGIEENVDRIKGFALAGNAFRGVGIPQCIASGYRAADKVWRDIAAH